MYANHLIDMHFGKGCINCFNAKSLHELCGVAGAPHHDPSLHKYIVDRVEPLHIDARLYRNSRLFATSHEAKSDK